MNLVTKSSHILHKTNTITDFKEQQTAIRETYSGLKGKLL